jgi:hypothetical protein
VPPCRLGYRRREAQEDDRYLRGFQRVVGTLLGDWGGHRDALWADYQGGDPRLVEEGESAAESVLSAQVEALGCQLYVFTGLPLVLFLAPFALLRGRKLQRGAVDDIVPSLLLLLCSASLFARLPSPCRIYTLMKHFSR